MGALFQFLRVLATGGPLFFMFHIRTKSYYYDLTLTLGMYTSRPSDRITKRGCLAVARGCKVLGHGAWFRRRAFKFCAAI